MASGEFFLEGKPSVATKLAEEGENDGELDYSARDQTRQWIRRRGSCTYHQSVILDCRNTLYTFDIVRGQMVVVYRSRQLRFSVFGNLWRVKR